MKDSTKILIFLFVFGIIILAFIQTGLVTFHWPPINLMTHTALAINSPKPSDTQQYNTPSQKTSTPTPPSIRVSATATPYIIVYPRFLYCRKSPSFISEVLFVIRGHQITLLAQSQNKDWLYISVENKKCWIYRDIPYLEATPNQVEKLPTVFMTLDFPPPKP